MQRLILAGGGHAHVEVLRRFGLDAPRDAEIVLISPSRYTVYSGMLPGLIAGHYSRRDAHIDVERLAHRAGARFICDAVIGVDPTRRLVYCAQHPETSYDWLSLDIGSVPNTGPIREAERFGLPVRPVDRLLAGVEALAQRVRQSDVDVAIVGAGAGGVELCFALDHRLRQEAGTYRARYSILTLTSEILPGYSEAVRRRTLRILEQRGVVVHTDSRVAGVSQGGVLLEDGRRIAADQVIWVTGPAPAAWLRESGLATDPDGFVLVDDRLQSVSHPQIFAAGDVATMAAHPRPKSGVYAVRQGPPLTRNLRCVLRGVATRSFRPQRRALQLISTGERYAIAAWGELSVEGAWVWRWKDWIDRRFVARYA
jgi:selenide,water dikinase